MFYKTYSFVLIFVCCIYFRDVFANIFIKDNTGTLIYHMTDDSSKQFGNLNMSFVNVKNVVAEIYLRQENYNSSQKNEKKIELKITFNEDNIILIYNEYREICSYNENGTIRLREIIQDLGYDIEFKVFENIRKNKHLIRDETAKKYLIDRSLKYMILLSIYAFNAIILQDFSKSFWGQLLELFKKIQKVMLILDRYNVIHDSIDQMIHAKSNNLYELKGLAEQCAKYFMNYEELTKYDFKYEVTDSFLYDNPILPQDLINKLLNGFPKQQNENSYNFHDIPKDLDKIMENLKLIFSLIHAEYNAIVY
ncbi:uncharacterized protein LOC126903067 isoform X8 [Daktulosphaira vitifoliae]|uniref:uncharacterized protein LOC126903067 isoform X6 n=2 Tax=Daktulosphaira vitifoliae TaxID=58002 RepID=UPI0021A9955B|nr:uncharacterized protein LOC126903067 isoform X6 [Daktulosphaira vitifoliae]XP_050536982.1 uncharacterized protein LOC126903067 isoform X7 [Daktulosphaira vitifoliae]XP_050536983.1 uncharacterized protein LOC126903067 isoform X8 [Daktulosphaira vitifoliae]